MNATPARRLSFLLPAMVVALAACAQPGGLAPSGTPSVSPSATRPVASQPPVSTVAPSEGVPVVNGEVPGQILEGILADAAGRTGVPEDAIEIVRAQQMTWNDGSLGCPEPGMFYTQALVDGYQVVLDADGEELDYRVDQGGSFRLCENGRPGG